MAAPNRIPVTSATVANGSTSLSLLGNWTSTLSAGDEFRNAAGKGQIIDSVGGYSSGSTSVTLAQAWSETALSGGAGEIIIMSQGASLAGKVVSILSQFADGLHYGTAHFYSEADGYTYENESWPAPSQLHIAPGMGLDSGGYIGSKKENHVYMSGGLLRDGTGQWTRKSAHGCGLLTIGDSQINYFACPGGSVGDVINPSDGWVWRIDEYGNEILGPGNLVRQSATSSGTVFPKLQVQGTTSTLAGLFEYSADANPAAFVFLKSRSPTIGNHAAVQSNDIIGQVAFNASDGTSFIRSACIRAVVNGSVTTGTVPTDLVFMTSNGDAYAERVRLSSSGLIQKSVQTYTSAIDGVQFTNSENAAHAYLQAVKIAGGAVNLLVAANAALSTGGSLAQLDNTRASATVNVRASDGSVIISTCGVGGTITNRVIVDATGNISMPNLQPAANNAAAIAAGLSAGMLYRTGGDPDTLCVVH